MKNEQRYILKGFLQPVFIIILILFVVHQILQKVFHVSFPLVDSYLDAFLCMPILLTFLLFERRVLYRSGSDYVLSLFEIFIVTVLLSFIFEVLFPYWSDDFTADWGDVAAYFAGSGIFYIFLNKPV